MSDLSSKPGLQTVDFEFESSSTAPGPQWKRKGSGQARFQISPDLLQVEESGKWWEAEATRESGHSFMKSFRLEKDPDKVLHYSKSTPSGERLELLRLIRGPDGVWTSPEPHLCIDDVYRAALSLEGRDGFSLTWWSRGPAKNYVLCTRYHGTRLIRNWLES
ncbi:MAG: DUF6314 family protein [Kiritimatiellia bacterium]